MVVTVPASADGGAPSISPLQGAVGFTSERYGAIVAHTADGCRWTLAVQGNTAELDLPTQTCQLASGTVRLFFWSAASDGEHESSVMAGVKDMNGRQATFYLYIGALTKQQQAATNKFRGRIGVPADMKGEHPTASATIASAD